MGTLLFAIKITPTVITTIVVALLFLTSAKILIPSATAQNISSSPSSSSLSTTTPVQNLKVNNNNNTGSHSNTTTTPSSAPSSTASSNKSFYIFTGETEGVNETKLGIPPDRFSPDILAVNEGDTVTIHFYNLDSDKDVAGSQNTTFTFRAGDEGAYTFYCTYHQPTMRGQLIVLPPPTVEKNATSSST
jgi:plastocyanin